MAATITNLTSATTTSTTTTASATQTQYAASATAATTSGQTESASSATSSTGSTSSSTTSTGTTTWVILGSKINGNYTTTKNADAPCLIFDSVESIDVDWSLDVSSYPIESGVQISDHVQEKNEQYSLTGWVTNTPIVAYEANQIGYTSYGSGLVNKNSRVKKAVTVLKTLKAARAPVTFVTEFEVLTNMIIKQVSFSQSASTSDAIAFKISLEKVRLATAQTTTINVTSTTNKTTASNKAAGSNTKEEATQPDQYGNGKQVAATVATNASTTNPSEDGGESAAEADDGDD